MVSSYNYLFLFTLILSLTFLRPTSSSADLINDICSTAKNPAYCRQFLKPLYNHGTSLKDLANQTIQSSKTLLFFTYDEIHVREIHSSILNPALNKQYKKCGVQYIAAVNALIRSDNILQSGDYKTLPSLASLALKQTQDCDLNFTPPGSEPADFKSLNEKSIDVCSVVLAVTNRLAAGGI